MNLGSPAIAGASDSQCAIRNERGFRLVRLGRAAAVLLALAVGPERLTVAAEEPAQAEVNIDAQGTVHVPAFEVPLSSYMSEAAKQAFIRRSKETLNPLWLSMDAPIERLRALEESEARDALKRATTRYPVTIEARAIAGVPTRIITPRAGVAPRNSQRVLLELHGGGFFLGANTDALLESMPVASVGGFRVIAVDYRQAPEHAFPAASEDVAKVYHGLLKAYAPDRIGLFGCSAGGTLAAMSVAWLQKEKLPRPGALGIFSAGAYGDFNAAPSTPGSWGGDSRFTAPPLVGEPALPADPRQMAPLSTLEAAYLRHADLRDPLVSPALSPAVLAKFPPTLLIAGTRGFDMSAAVQTHRQLVRAGVPADLQIWDGMGHCFFTDVDLPESQEAFAIMTQFFDSRLAR